MALKNGHEKRVLAGRNVQKSFRTKCLRGAQRPDFQVEDHAVRPLERTRCIPRGHAQSGLKNEARRRGEGGAGPRGGDQHLL